MATFDKQAALSIALIGNPNTGKSTVFNSLAGMLQRVGNYPGVTVEKKLGRMTYEGRTCQLIDLPGTYSLAPRSPDEMVAVDVLLGRRPDVPPVDVVLCIVDASNLERNLYLLSQVLELGLPVVLVLNMIDVAEKRGVTIDVQRLRQRLGLEVIQTQANTRRGIDEVKAAIMRAADRIPPSVESPFPEPFQREVKALAALLQNGEDSRMPRYLVERLLLDTSGYLNSSLTDGDAEVVDRELTASRRRLAEAGCAVPAVEAIARYDWVARVLEKIVTRPSESRITWSDRLDRVLTHRFWGMLIFAAVMIVVFQSVFSWAGWAMDPIDQGFSFLGGAIEGAMAEGPLRSLIVDGAIAGVGSVLIFLPQIFILFLFIAILEDCGYMARAAYLMDKLMARVGLSGKSFIPLLSSFACAIPGIMAARVIENRRDRLTTILVAPLMSCSARLPVYTILIAAFIPDRSFAGGWFALQGFTLFCMYMVGIVAAVVVALVLKKTLLRGATPPFVMELPGYKIPSIRTVVLRMLDRGWAFIRRAGTLIFAVSIVVWASLYYPHNSEIVEAPYRGRQADIRDRLASLPKVDPQRADLQREQAELDNRVAGAYQRQSILGRAGRWIEPAVKPLGWDWRIGCAAISSFPAREIVISSLGIIYDLGGDYDIEGEDQGLVLQQKLRSATWDGTDRAVYNVPVALSIMVFFALCAQCMATLFVMKRETNSWGWPAFTFVYMTALAYLGALVTYQIGMLF